MDHQRGKRFQKKCHAHGLNHYFLIDGELLILFFDNKSNKISTGLVLLVYLECVCVCV